LQKVQAVRRLASEVIATLVTSAICLNPAKYPNPGEAIPDVMKFNAGLGITKADLPLKLRQQVDGALTIAAATPPGKKDKKDKKDKQDDKEKKDKKDKQDNKKNKQEAPATPASKKKKSKSA
jgi:hypothetical protein